MHQPSRRSFIKASVAAGTALAFPRILKAAATGPVGANDAIRVAVVGLGSTDAVGGVGGRGHQLIASLLQVPDVRIAALCDVDEAFLRREAKPLTDRGIKVATHRDMRRVFEDPAIDAVVVATPNHWHGLATVWACQAGKDVYVEKPFSYNWWEGRQMVAAARKHNRVVQTGTQNRSSPLMRQAAEELRSGRLGRIRVAHAIMYRGREGIGRVEAPVAPPSTLDYDLWCGPAPKAPLRRRQVHYEWHWFWETGNGEIGNNGVHMMDLCRMVIGSTQPPRRALSIGGRFAANDSAETPNTQIALLDFDPVPLICEVRNVRQGTNTASIGNFRGRTRGVFIDCEGGSFAGDSSGGAFFDPQGRKIRDVTAPAGGGRLEVAHLANFFAAMRSRNSADLACEAWEGHCSAAACHFANISHRIGRAANPGEIRERSGDRSEFTDAFERCREHLAQNGVDLARTPPILGPSLNFDVAKERFTGEFAEAANARLRREYRAPFVMPEKV